MVLKVGINGFGRIGRVIFRTCLQNNDLEVAAINDPAIDIEYICYLLKFDSTHGKLKCDITFLKNEITINGNIVKVFCEKLPSNIPWHSASVQYVVDASGMFTSYEKASGHLSSQSVRRVLVTAPSVDVPMLIIGVNEDSIKKDYRVVSCASSTLYCLAPIIKILEDNYQVMEGFITSIHAMTPSLKPLDGLCLRGKHWRDHRSIHQNIIPAATGACKALGKIIPGVKDKLTGLAFRVPIVNVSVLDISIRLNQKTSIKDIVKCIDNGSRFGMKNIIRTSNDEAVSSDFLGEEKSCILDVNSSLELTPYFFKLICWYENEYSYACRVVDSIQFLDKINQFDLVAKMTYTKPITSERIDDGLPIPFYNRDNMNYKNVLRNNSIFGGFKTKLPQRHICPRQPFSLRSLDPNELVRDPKERTDNSKILKNDELLVKPPQETSIFQSCIAFSLSKKERSNYIKTKEYLEEVKKDFSRMVDMTQNLLKKSKESNIQLPNNSTEENTKVKMSSDCSKACSNSNSLSDNNYQVESYKFNDNVFDSCNKVEEVDKKSSVNNKSKLNENEYLNSKLNNCSDFIVNYAKPLHNIYKLQKNIQTIKHSFNDLEKPNYLPSEEINNRSLCIDDDKNNIDSSRMTKESITEVASNISTTMNEPITKTEIELHNLSPNKDMITVEQIQTKDDIQNNNKNNSGSSETFTRGSEIKKKIIEGIIKTISIDSSFDTPSSPSPVNTNTTLSGMGSKMTDIYDKLDSISGTDSENSFQLNEKVSEVIEITDLTSSVEDLARLDKICRIIEISDELSDKLFSALDNNNGDFKKKKWSFKDLCKNIKLDDFCDKVFGQSSRK